MNENHYQQLINKVYIHHSGRAYKLNYITNKNSTDFVKFPVTAIYTSEDDGQVWSRPLLQFLTNFKYKYEDNSIDFNIMRQSFCTYLTYGRDTTAANFAVLVADHLLEN